MIFPFPFLEFTPNSFIELFYSSRFSKYDHSFFESLANQVEGGFSLKKRREGISDTFEGGKKILECDKGGGLFDSAENGEGIGSIGPSLLRRAGWFLITVRGRDINYTGALSIVHATY